MGKHDSFVDVTELSFLCASCGRPVRGYTVGTGVNDGGMLLLYVDVGDGGRAERVPYCTSVVLCRDCAVVNG